MERRSINPPNMNNKPRNGPLSPRDHRERDYIHYNSMNNHHHYSNHSSSNNNNSHHNSHHSPQQQHHHHQQPPPPQQSFHPNSDLINFVSSAWKEKVSSDKTEYFKSTESEKYREFDLDSWMSAKMRNST